MDVEIQYQDKRKVKHRMFDRIVDLKHVNEMQVCNLK